MTQTTDASRVIDKIRKLLTLAEHENTGAEEAATAAALAQEMVERYNLDMAQVRGAVSKDQIVMKTLELTNSHLWASWLMSSLAEFNFCQFLVIRREKVGWVIGEATNVAIVLELGRSLASQLGVMADASYLAFRKNRKRGDPDASAATYKTNFLNGAVVTIHLRLQAQRQQMVRAQQEEEAVTNTNRGLMVIDQHRAAVNAYITEHVGRIRNDRARSKTQSRVGFHEGVKAGERVELQKKLH